MLLVACRYRDVGELHDMVLRPRTNHFIHVGLTQLAFDQRTGGENSLVVSMVCRLRLQTMLTKKISFACVVFILPGL